LLANGMQALIGILDGAAGHSTRDSDIHDS